jgi:hypothetical protein
MLGSRGVSIDARIEGSTRFRIMLSVYVLRSIIKIPTPEDLTSEPALGLDCQGGLRHSDSTRLANSLGATINGQILNSRSSPTTETRWYLSHIPGESPS